MKLSGLAAAVKEVLFSDFAEILILTSRPCLVSTLQQKFLLGKLVARGASSAPPADRPGPAASRPGWAWARQAIPPGAVEVLPLSVEISAEANDLPGSFANDDPFDQIIVATARIHDLTVVSCDGAVREYPHVRKWCYRRRG